MDQKDRCHPEELRQNILQIDVKIFRIFVVFIASIQSCLAKIAHRKKYLVDEGMEELGVTFVVDIVELIKSGSIFEAVDLEYVENHHEHKEDDKEDREKPTDIFDSFLD